MRSGPGAVLVLLHAVLLSGGAAESAAAGQPSPLAAVPATPGTGPLQRAGGDISPEEALAVRYDLLVIGATPGGIAMSVRAAREGATVALISRQPHLGGMLSSGLGVWDTLYEGRRAPIYDGVRRAIFDYYRDRYGPDSRQYRDCLPGRSGHTNGKFEPHVAEKVLTDLVNAEPRIVVFRGFEPVGADRKGRILQSVTFGRVEGAGSITLSSKIFADCSYEADLLPIAGVGFRIGREPKSEFQEPHAGVIFMGQTAEPPNPAAARAAQEHRKLNLRKFPGHERILAGSTGARDDAIQAGNYRTILTSEPADRLPIPNPGPYEPARLAGIEMGAGIKPIPNGKVGLNRAQILGAETRTYATSDWETRRRIMDEHWNLTLATLWFYQHDPAAPAELRARWAGFGLPKDEFRDNGHRPYEFYLREGRRLAGRFTFTEQDVTLLPDVPCAPVHPDSIAAIEWYIDSHPCLPREVDGSMPEGKMMLHQESFPGQLPYGALLSEEVDNLLVPVNVSATHVAWNTVRLEPTWMNIGESAAYAVLRALEERRTPAQIDVDELVRTLATRHVMIAFLNDVDVAADDPAVAAAEYFATKGFFAGYDADLLRPLSRPVAIAWASAFRRLGDERFDAAAVLRQVQAAAGRKSAPVGSREFATLLGISASRHSGSSVITRREALLMMWDARAAQGRRRAAVSPHEPALQHLTSI